MVLPAGPAERRVNQKEITPRPDSIRIGSPYPQQRDNMSKSSTRAWRAYLAASKSTAPPRPSAAAAKREAWMVASRGGLAGVRGPIGRTG